MVGAGVENIYVVDEGAHDAPCGSAVAAVIDIAAAWGIVHRINEMERFAPCACRGVTVVVGPGGNRGHPTGRRVVEYALRLGLDCGGDEVLGHVRYSCMAFVTPSEGGGKSAHARGYE